MGHLNLLATLGIPSGLRMGSLHQLTSLVRTNSQKILSKPDQLGTLQDQLGSSATMLLQR